MKHNRTIVYENGAQEGRGIIKTKDSQRILLCAQTSQQGSSSLLEYNCVVTYACTQRLPPRGMTTAEKPATATQEQGRGAIDDRSFSCFAVFMSRLKSHEPKGCLS